MKLMKRSTNAAPTANKPICYGGHRFPAEVISYAVWLYFLFQLSLRMVEEMLAARGIEVTYETVRRWSVKFGLGIAPQIRSNVLARGDKWHPPRASEYLGSMPFRVEAVPGLSAASNS